MPGLFALPAKDVGNRTQFCCNRCRICATFGSRQDCRFSWLLKRHCGAPRCLAVTCRFFIRKGKHFYSTDDW